MAHVSRQARRTSVGMMTPAECWTLVREYRRPATASVAVVRPLGTIGEKVAGIVTAAT